MSSHYKTSAPIPDEEIISLAASRKANAGFINLRQILLGTFDQNIHTQEQVFSQFSSSLVGASICFMGRE